MELTNAQKSKLLNDAIDLLEQADALIQQALGASDVCYDTHTRLADIVDDLVADVVEFDNGLV